ARYLFIEYGCHGCHLTKGFENLPKVGPDLRRISSKVTKDWAAKWIENPKAFKPYTRMPRYFHNSNNSDPESIERNQVEIRSIVEYLFAKSEDVPLAPSGLTGDPDRGKQLVMDVGCRGCHLTQGEKPADINTRRHFGPPLVNIGSKTNATWLYNWLKEPRHYSPLTRMPNMKLSDQEATDITAYLLSLHDTAWEAKAVPATQDKWLKDEILFYLKRTYGLQAESEYDKMNQQQRYEFLGEKMISRYGCFGCHWIKGFENAKGIGTSLTEEGSKRVTKFDFGFVPIEHTPVAYVAQKLRDPRSFDVIEEHNEDKPRVKRWDEKLIMPNFGFNEDEIEHLDMLVMGLTKEKVPIEAQRVLTDREQVAEKGKWLLLQKNCVACHNIDGWGGEIRTIITEQGMAPPLLISEGEKVQSDWLFKFLKNPGQIRPWLKVRMPNFRLSDEEANTLVQSFMASASSAPFSTPPDIHQSLPEGQQLFTTFQCALCHVVGNKVPEGKTAADLAPNLTMAATRLRPEWILKWLNDPQKYQPGTRMPDFFPEAALPNLLGGDPDKQVEAIRNYLFSIGQGDQTSIETPEQFESAGKAAVATAHQTERSAETGGQR
ncbi:MAG TPA: c-type cytochrome, partial [Acidobacteriota bacterium]|nr:c-type cytochrome [Acidobacteriota bacterium]